MERAERHSSNWSRGVPFSRGIREFLAESRKCQTLYANCEGTYDRRVFKKEDEDLLKDYIYNTVYYSGGDDFRLSEKGRVHEREVDSLQRKIFDISNDFGFRQEAHVSVVWVYYYAFASGKGLSFPVFKIYKTKLREDAVFLNLEFRDHESWDSYLENERFPDAFICVPRHGEYHFYDVEDKLDLEFVTSRRAPNRFPLESAPRHLSCSVVRLYSPFCQNVVRPVIDKIKSFGLAVIAKIKAILPGLLDFWNKHGDTILNGVVCVVVALTHAFSMNWSGTLSDVKSSDFLEYLSSSCLMLLNTKPPTDDKAYKTLTKPFFTNDIPSLTNDTQSLRAIFNNSLGPKAPTQEEEEGVLELISLLREQKKNWKRILKIFCSFFRKCRPLLLNALQFFGCFPGTLAIITVLLVLAENLECSNYLNPHEEPTEDHRSLPSTTQSTEFNGSVIPALSFSENEVKPSTSFGVIEKPRPPNNFAKKVGDKVKVQSTSLEKLLVSLSDLEEVSARNIEKKEVVEVQSYPVINDLVVQDVDGFRICFMPNPGYQQLIDYLIRLLGTKVSLKPEGPFVFHVLGPTGSIEGYLYFPQPFTVIGLFPLKNNARKEPEKIKILEEI